jgi:hypothetical protein
MGFLNPETKFPQTPSLDKVMTQWYESPLTTAIFDFEYNSVSLIHIKDGCLYRLIFPEDEEIYSNWHDAGFDVRMTIRLIEFYLTRVSRKPAQGKLEFYFPPARPILPTAHLLPVAEPNDGRESGSQVCLLMDGLDEGLLLPGEQEIEEIEEPKGDLQIGNPRTTVTKPHASTMIGKGLERD